MTNALTLCATRNNLASNIWMGPSQHGLQKDASCRVRCSWNQNPKRGPTGSRTASTPESKRTNILKFGRRNWRQPRPTPTPCRRQWCPIFWAPFSNARPLPGCTSDQRPGATQSNRPQWQTDGKRTQTHGQIADTEASCLATRHKSRGRGAPSRPERIGLSRAPERKRKLKIQKRTDLCTQTAAKLIRSQQCGVRTAGASRRGLHWLQIEAPLYIMSWVHAEADNIHPNSSRIMRHMEKGRMNAVSNQTVALQAQRQKDEAGRDQKKSHAASLVLPRVSGNGT